MLNIENGEGLVVYVNTGGVYTVPVTDTSSIEKLGRPPVPETSLYTQRNCTSERLSHDAGKFTVIVLGLIDPVPVKFETVLMF